jgi:Domain of unknown function (DUF1830)
MQGAAAKNIHELRVGPDQETRQAMGEQNPTVFSEPILCCYVNTTSRIQVARLSHLSEGDWEHIMFPGQRFMFEAPPEAILAIYKSPNLSVTVPEYTPCYKLRVSSN